MIYIFLLYKGDGAGFNANKRQWRHKIASAAVGAVERKRKRIRFVVRHRKLVHHENLPWVVSGDSPLCLYKSGKEYGSLCDTESLFATKISRGLSAATRR